MNRSEVSIIVLVLELDLVVLGQLVFNTFALSMRRIEISDQGPMKLAFIARTFPKTERASESVIGE